MLGNMVAIRLMASSISWRLSEMSRIFTMARSKLKFLIHAGAALVFAHPVAGLPGALNAATGVFFGAAAVPVGFHLPLFKPAYQLVAHPGHLHPPIVLGLRHSEVDDHTLWPQLSLLPMTSAPHYS